MIEPAQVRATGERRRVLVVDDSAFMRMLVSEVEGLAWCKTACLSWLPVCQRRRWLLPVQIMSPH